MEGTPSRLFSPKLPRLAPRPSRPLAIEVEEEEEEEEKGTGPTPLSMAENDDEKDEDAAVASNTKAAASLALKTVDNFSNLDHHVSWARSRSSPCPPDGAPACPAPTPLEEEPGPPIFPNNPTPTPVKAEVFPVGLRSNTVPPPPPAMPRGDMGMG